MSEISILLGWLNVMGSGMASFNADIDTATEH
jgi:hypothetical protein